MTEIKIPTLADIPEAVEKFLQAMDDRTVYAFRGEMGVGKTTFIRALCQRLGISDAANSPSFSIINEYRSDDTAELVYHFDCYRLENEEEGEDIGVEDYFWSGALCLVEWPEKIENLLPGDVVNVEMKLLDDDSRLMIID